MKKEDYSHTLNLPRTEFRMKADLPKNEPSIQKFWERNDIYHKMVKKGGRTYILHDGPPYANEDIHLGQAMNKILKDVVIKYKNMEGYSAPFIPGWDCHGLPVELQLFKKLNIKRKEEVDAVEFRTKAREFASRYVERQKKQFRRLGILGEWDNPYITMDYSYESKILEVFQLLWDEGYIYLDKKPIYWCISCETALAEAEVEYLPHTSPSIWVKFPIINYELGIKNEALKLSTQNLQLTTYIIIWTTTPWTIPANLAVALHPEYEYALVQIKNVERWLIAKDLVDSTTEKLGIKDYKVVEMRKGKELEGIHYRHPLLEKNGKIVLADYVSLEEGTGCVHTAPGHGEEDYRTGLKYGLPVFSPVDEKGIFTGEIADLEGKQVFEANAHILQILKECGLLLKTENIQHSYPHCWRCKNPVIFRACKQWFMGVDRKDLRKRALRSIEEVEWLPPLSLNRIKGTLEARPDWCLSRQRLWGVAIPGVYCEKCGKEIVDRHITDRLIRRVKEEGSDAWFRHSVDTFLPRGFSCPKCKSTQHFKKEQDILDVWLDSGISHIAVLKTSKSERWPADLYLEGSDQHRGWFQTSLLTSVALYDKPPYHGVLTHGFVVDSEGKKMSKSVGNVTDPQVVVDKYGGDILRLWCVSSQWRTDVRIGDEILKRCIEAYRKIRNTARFLLGNLYDYSYPENSVPESKWAEIDRWAYNRVHILLRNVKEAYRKFEFMKAYQYIYQFSIGDMSSIYLDILKDRLYILPADSLERKSAQTVLYFILRIFTQLIAPFLSFTAEEIWQNFNFKEESVFLSLIPEEEKIDEELDKKWERILNLREAVQKSLEEQRQKGIIGTSLEAEVILHTDEVSIESLGISVDELATIFIVSKVTIKPPRLCATESERKGVKLKQFQETLETVKIEIRKAPGNKCERCWKWSKDVGKIDEFPGVCPRCVKILKNKGW